MLCSTDQIFSPFSIQGASDRQPYPIQGWPLHALARLDQAGARGLVADLTLAGALRRQAAFLFCACVDLDSPTEWLARLGVRDTTAEHIGTALRSRPVRNLVAATFGVTPALVPNRFLRALERVQDGAARAGMQPFDGAPAYHHLWTVMGADPHDRRARALSSLATLSTASLEAVERLEPLLLQPEILKGMKTQQQVEDANALLHVLRASRPHLSDEQITKGLRQALKAGKSLQTFLNDSITRAERLPEPPVPAAVDLRPLTTAADLREFGLRMRNCAADKIAEAALGLSYVYEVTHREEDGTATILAVELTPLTDVWMVNQIKLKHNQRPKRHIILAVCARLRSMGILIPGPPSSSLFTRSMARHLSVFYVNGLEYSDLGSDDWDIRELAIDEEFA